MTIAANEEKSTLSSETSAVMPLNLIPSDKLSEEESHVNGDIAVKEYSQLSLEQEPIAAER